MKKILITGNVGRDPEMRADQSGGQFASFSVGISVGKDKTDWADITCSGKLAEIARQYIKKGSKLLIEGFPSVNAYMSRENKPIGTLRIYANNIEFLSSPTKESPDGSHDTSTAYILPDVVQEGNNNSSLTSDDIPF